LDDYIPPEERVSTQEEVKMKSMRIGKIVGVLTVLAAGGVFLLTVGPLIVEFITSFVDGVASFYNSFFTPPEDASKAKKEMFFTLKNMANLLIMWMFGLFAFRLIIRLSNPINRKRRQ
jgi:ABC-type sulfate transport system permease subunit